LAVAGSAFNIVQSIVERTTVPCASRANPGAGVRSPSRFPPSWKACHDPVQILIIEDDPTILRVVKDNFATRGYHVQIARDGEDGLDAALNGRPDLILLDVMLPKIMALKSAGPSAPRNSKCQSSC